MEGPKVHFLSLTHKQEQLRKLMQFIHFLSLHHRNFQSPVFQDVFYPLTLNGQFYTNHLIFSSNPTFSDNTGLSRLTRMSFMGRHIFIYVRTQHLNIHLCYGGLGVPRDLEIQRS